jgi:hypothetical protein
MASIDKKDRATDLPIPETDKIAQLLAELMPPGMDLPDAPLAAEPADEAAPVLSAAAVAFEELEPTFAPVPVAPAEPPPAGDLVTGAGELAQHAGRGSSPAPPRPRPGRGVAGAGEDEPVLRHRPAARAGQVLRGRHDGRVQLGLNPEDAR